MSTNQTDNQRPLPRSNILQSQGRPPIRSISQGFAHPHPAPIRQVSFDASTLRSLEPSAKRPKIEHESLLQRTRERVYTDLTDPDGQKIESLGDSKRDETPYKLPPFPSRPGAHLQRTQSPVHLYFQNKEPVSSKPYVLEIPKIAPRYADKQPADFFPWTGDKPEDTLNEQTIKNGYFDKSTAPQTESTPGRPAIWPNVKNKSGLQHLSSLFITTLQQRQKFGAVSTASTFKPPPRATLTEPKREIWLKDLADPDISLRRLSRTIPHGIRGKTLLDHCMAKRIPFERAIWLVKCVGANEIRAFKRKGPNMLAPGTEAKWVREWTTHVEEFVDALIENCGSPEWKENMNYGLQLVVHIYAESLIDKEHFLEWIVTSLQAAPAHKIPIWLLITQMYWNELPKCRKFGKKLATALCEQASHLHGRVVEANRALWDKITALITKLISVEPACFVLPNQWSTYSVALEAACVDQREAFDEIRQRNEELERSACMPGVGDPRQQILNILDAKDVLFDIKMTSRRCLSVCPDMDLLATTLCQWATTKYRPGLEHMYLCLRLLRRWTKSKLHLEPVIFSFIRSCSGRLDLDEGKLFKLVSELVRSKHVSIPRYLQWIMAQGNPLSLEKEVLISVPLHELPDYAQNLCQMVLDRPLPQDSKLADLQSTIKERLFNDAMVDEDLNYKPISELRLPEQYQLAHWIRGVLLNYADGDGQLASYDDLTTICRLLETINDFGVLADALGVYAEVGDVSLLPLVSDTVNKHFDCLHAIGAAEGICETILERMEEIPNRSPAQKSLIQSLVDLVAKLPRRARTLLVLQRELALCEPKSAIAACSPVSDTMGETQEDINFFEEIERLFGNGTSMDRPLLTRIFTDIVKRLETSWTEDIFTSINLAEFLVRLRSFNREIFSTLMPTWVGTILTTHQDIKMILAVLICGGLVEVQDLYTRLVTQTADTKAMSPTTLLELSDLLIETPNLPRSYYLRTEINSMIDNDPKTLARFLSMVLDIAGPSILAKPGLRDLVLRLSHQEPAVQELFPNFKPALLADLALGMGAEADFIQQLPNVLCYFNSTLCAGKLRKTLNEYTKTNLNGLPPAIVRDVSESSVCKAQPWKMVIKTLPPPIILETHKILISSFLESQSSLPHESEESLLCLVGLVENNLDAQDLVSTITTLTDQLSKIQSSSFRTTNAPELSLAAIEPSLQIILRLIGIHANVFSQARVPLTTSQHLCLSLSNLYLHPLIISNTTLAKLLLNTLTLLSDTIPSETREQIIHALNSQTVKSSTLEFLFGPPAQNSVDSDLELVTTPSADAAQAIKDKSKLASKPSGISPFVLHRWEMVQDATPVIGDNDTSLSLALFGARKAVL